MRMQRVFLGVLLLVQPSISATSPCDGCSPFQTVASAAADVVQAVNAFDDAIVGLDQPTYRIVFSLTNNLDARARVIESTASRAALETEAAPGTLQFLADQLAGVDAELQTILSEIQEHQDQEEAQADALQAADQYGPSTLP